ncbi:hypothetical protein PpBr36_07523 [Pyricularia pennisetigena]|uniref:hypothetical protein n=1 Tax=Pyricularia pennisetigena TaxID=1578925 RepID=UPI001153D3F6|nr:hypothetical protein PpBr36_07523 [Pyricularia pennisetigena]TLS25384.1 hypothetical protein PpBr36_07523 [Pyricularia pennisetigena]
MAARKNIKRETMLNFTATHNIQDNPEDSFTLGLRRGFDPTTVAARIFHFVKPLSNPSGSSISSSSSSSPSLSSDENTNAEAVQETKNGSGHAHKSPRDGPASSSTSDKSAPLSDPSPDSKSLLGDGHENDEQVGDQQEQDAVAKKLWEKLAARRKTRSKLRKKKEVLRQSLKTSELQVTQADNLFLNQVRRVLFQDSTVSNAEESSETKKDLLTLFNNIQEERSKHSMLQSDLEELEGDLSREEVGLERAEEDFLQQVYRSQLEAAGGLARPTVGKILPKKETQQDLPSSASLRGIRADLAQDYHPLYSRLLKAAARKKVEEEELENLILERNYIVRLVTVKHLAALARERQEQVDDDTVFEIRPEDTAVFEKQLRDPTNIDILARKYNVEEEDVDFLKGFEQREKEFDQIVAGIVAEICHLKSLCIERGAMPRYPEPSYEYDINIALGLPTEQVEEEMADPIFNGRAFVPIVRPGFIPKPPPKWPNDPLSLRNPRFFVLLSDPKHVLEEKPAQRALKDAVQMVKRQVPANAVQDDTAVRKNREVQRYVKEINIENLILNADPSKKADFINRWLMHKLRTSTLEMLVLLMVSMTTLSLSRIANWAAWQYDIARFWTRDDAFNIPEEVFDGPRTSTLRSQDDEGDSAPRAAADASADVSAEFIRDIAVLSRRNSVIEPPSSMQSDLGQRWRPHVDSQTAARVPSHRSV